MTAILTAPALHVYRVNLSVIPAKLKALRSWCVWRLEEVDGKPTKVPYMSDFSRRASSTNQETWSDFDTAVATLTGACGLGFVLSPEAGVTFVDLDHVIDADGRSCIWAKRLLEMTPSYVEISPSGTGIHLLVEGPALPQGRKCGCVELHSTKRFLTVTGDRLLNSPTEIATMDISWLFSLVDAGVFNFARYPDLEKLMLGDWIGYPSQSEADLALCSMLKRLVNGPGQIDRAFRLSGLYREKWDSPRGDSTYGQQTIERALETDSTSQLTPSAVTSITAQPANRRSGLILTKDGTPKPYIVADAVAALHSPEWQGCLAFDQFAMRVKLRQSPPWGGPAERDWTDQDDTACTVWMQHAGIVVNSGLVHDAVLLVANQNPFHPVRDYLNSLSWDGVPRIERWLSTYLGVAESEYSRAVGKAWLISAVSRIVSPGNRVDHVLTAEGPQGIRKSTAIQTLTGNPAWFADHIADLCSKDSRVDLAGKWIIELSELSNIKRAAVFESVKSFLTVRVDHYRPPYGRTSIDVPRQNVFAGTTNSDRPFVDPTGSRRFWPVRCGDIDIEGIEAARDQLWAESAKCYLAGEPWWLTTPELNALAESEQGARYEGDSWDDLAESWIAEPQTRTLTSSIHDPLPWFGSRPGKINITDLLVHGLGRDPGELRQADQNRAARYFIHRKWERRREGSGANRGKWYYFAPSEAIQ